MIYWTKRKFFVIFVTAYCDIDLPEDRHIVDSHYYILDESVVREICSYY